MMEIENIKELVEGLSLSIEAWESLDDPKFIESCGIDKERVKTLILKNLKNSTVLLVNGVMNMIKANEEEGW